MSPHPALTALLALAAAGGAALTAAHTPVPRALEVTLATASDSVDRAVVALLSKADQTEIAEVRQAAPTLRDPEVKKYAQMLIDDHTRAYSTLSAIGAKLGYPTTSAHMTMPPADPMPSSNKPYERPGPSPSDPAAAAPTHNPDREFIEGQITAHQQLISQLPTNDSAIQNQELRTHVGQVRLAVQTHLSEARRLRDKVAGAVP